MYYACMHVCMYKMCVCVHASVCVSVCMRALSCMHICMCLLKEQRPGGCEFGNGPRGLRTTIVVA